MKAKLFITLITLLVMNISCQKKVNIDAEKTAVNAVINDMEKVFETNDAELLSKIVSHNPDNIFLGTDAAECFVGYDNFMEAQKRFFISVEKGGEMTFRDVVTKIGKNGDVAWVSCLMDWKGKSQGQPFAYEGLRMTIVLEKQDGKWLIVHLHGSVPVSGQSVKY
jgi:uncharacterized protein (TIGR02246 family)